MDGGSSTVYIAVHCTVAHIIMGGFPTMCIAVHCTYGHGGFSYSVHSCTLHTWPWGGSPMVYIGVLNGIMVSTGTVYIVQYCSNVHIAAFLLGHMELLTSSNATVSGCPV